MIWQLAMELNEVVALGREGRWPRPAECLGCGRGQVWGHGFVGRYFDGLAQRVLLRCYRCPGCRCVMTPRPAGFLRRVRTTVAAIRDELHHRLTGGQWPRAPTPRRRHWLRNLRRQALAWVGWTADQGLLAAFDQLLAAGVVAVGRAMQTGKPPAPSSPQ